MPTLATPEGVWLWSLLLAIALYLPLRRLIFVLAMRRELRRAVQDGGTAVPLPRQSVLKRRAAVTAVLIALIFAALYVHVLAGRLAAPPS
jgi:hypothetical protein